MKANVIKKKLLLFLLGQIIIFGSIGAFAKVLVLVPGYFNSLIPGFHEKNKYNPYWSEDIVNVYRKAGFKVFPVNNLNPLGTIEENGARLLRYLDHIQKYIDPKEGFSVIAHSAGGLYTIEANNRRKLPIQKLIAINTPFDGVDFIERITNAFPWLEELTKALNLESLNQLRPSVVRQFLNNLKRKPEFPIVGVIGSQQRNPSDWPADWIDAAFLSPIFYLTQLLMDSDSDGVVTHRSALREIVAGIKISFFEGYIHLDHCKQNFDADYYKWMGMQNTNYIRQEQVRFYKTLIPQL